MRCLLQPSHEHLIKFLELFYHRRYYEIYHAAYHTYYYKERDYYGNRPDLYFHLILYEFHQWIKQISEEPSYYERQ